MTDAKEPWCLTHASLLFQRHQIQKCIGLHMGRNSWKHIENLYEFERVFTKGAKQTPVYYQAFGVAMRDQVQKQLVVLTYLIITIF